MLIPPGRDASPSQGSPLALDDAGTGPFIHLGEEYLGFNSGRYFFLIDTDGSRRSEAASPEPLSNPKHGLFHIRYFENGPLEPGSVKSEKVEKRSLSKETTRRARLEPRSLRC